MSSAMSIQAAYQVSLLSSTFLCTTVFGFLLVFSIVIMPGISLLSDANMLQAFKSIDGIIQRNQPVFVATWIGAVLVLILTTGLAYAPKADVTSASKVRLLAATILFVIGQIITVTANIPRNNRLQELKIYQLDDSTLATERAYFEMPWRRWNTVRTVLFLVTSLLLGVTMLQEQSVLGKDSSNNRNLLEESKVWYGA